MEQSWYVLFGGPGEGVYSVSTGGPEARELFEISESNGLDFIGFGRGKEAEERAKTEYRKLTEARDQPSNVRTSIPDRPNDDPIETTAAKTAPVRHLSPCGRERDGVIERGGRPQRSGGRAL